MYAILIIIMLILFGLFIAALRKSWEWETSKMFCYFEWQYKGEIGTTKFYGPMDELDAVGAMEYRKSLGAEIIFSSFKATPEEIEDIITTREYQHSVMMNQKARPSDWR